ncbi:Connector enhancer of kinase suppressor of ras 2 [Acipenser ruthenus]|uniref:Connector enhancer of kinase suppressor of ras 2 n=1 Tax=Acipenser ruthenus TaxID=7906 RepID=A0A662YK07_ACIRT|nr:Connector enhancer of kinase suppressor of ras 2 [Acipenser ruthenus]
MDHFRKSFIKRNKNPVINEKALRLRALKSTLKVSYRRAFSPHCSKGENSEEKSLGGGSEVSEAGGDSGYSLSQSTWYDSDQEGELLSKGDQTPPSLTTPESPVREGSVHSPGISPESAGAPSDPSFLPGTLELKRYSWQRRHSFEQQGSDSEMAAQTQEERASRKSNTKGVRSTASRRRISCRELGKADCEGWLWNKKNESSVFVTQKWQRFWFVLKGPSLYWYNSQHVSVTFQPCSAWAFTDSLYTAPLPFGVFPVSPCSLVLCSCCSTLPKLPYSYEEPLNVSAPGLNGVAALETENNPLNVSTEQGQAVVM